ncbi:MAG: MarR family transcriptional regulator [Acidimicrobiaceae bacterium]|nr:MarR family transcriptional regulator [Acidimicrobiaceae bacterium]
MTGNKIPLNVLGPSSPAWSFLTKHAQVLIAVSNDPEVRLRDIAATVDLTERRVQSILNDLIVANYVIKVKSGRRNRYAIHEDPDLFEVDGREGSIAQIARILRLTSGARQSVE